MRPALQQTGERFKKETVMSDNMPALELKNLTKSFGSTKAADRVDLTVPAGSFYGLAGPNGAGKTTCLSMVTGLLRPDKGSVHIFGVDMWKEPVRAKALIGVLPDGLSMPERLTGREVLQYLGLLRGLDAATVAMRAQELLEVLELLDAEQTLVLDYSTGMRKKIALATALLHSPKLLVLDEPFEAVDPISAATIKSILRRFVGNSGSVIFSSHVMAVIEQICDSLAIVNKGHIVAAGTVRSVCNGKGLEQRFVELVGGHVGGEKGLAWLTS
jgi:ABC-2 type transport system ATP-binding protein